MSDKTFFIGGSPCAGKSTLADLFAQKHGIGVYHCDEYYTQHLERATSEQPTLKIFQTRSWLEVMTRPLPDMVRDELQANLELSVLALEDVRQFERPCIAEGMPFMPDVMAKLELTVKPVYLTPTPEFQREQYAKREWAWQLLAQTSDPNTVFDAWMTRDTQTAQFVKSRAQTLGFAVLEVDGSISVLETLAWLEAQFKVL